MREIKFRGKHIDNGEWVVGSLEVTHDSKTFMWLPIPPLSTIVQVKPETVGQFTGCRDDKHDVDIYEGDNIKVKDDCGEEYETTVKYEDGAFIAEVDGQDYDVTALGWAMGIWDNNGDDWEVIGNIHDAVIQHE